MRPDTMRLWSYGIAVLAVLLVYRRLRRSVGRQPIRPLRMRVRIGLLLAVACLLAPQALKSAQCLAAELAGILAGAALAVWGAQRTRFQLIDGRLHYLLHTYTGIAVSLLLVARLIYRFVLMSSMTYPNGSDGVEPMTSAGAFPGAGSPLTVGLLSVVVGYYVCYYGWVLWKSKRISPEDLEAGSAPTAAPP